MSGALLGIARRIGAVLACLLLLTWIAGAQQPRPKLLKVFLADFEDIPRPDRYTREYFENLFFGIGSPRESPEGRPVMGSVREYFLDVSEGRLDIEGEVADWVRIPRQITKIPHWKRGMKPFGESWPVIVAETLRAHGIVGQAAQQKIRLADGRRPELLVFLNTDWGTGGVNRGWGRLKEVLEKMKLGHLWDEAWRKLPAPYSSYSATKWRKAPRSGIDGTIDKTPAAGDLELFPLSIMMHEMGHQLAGWPDLYGPAYEPWGVFDLMGGPAASTHFPMAVCSYLRRRSGWMQYTPMPRRTHTGLRLKPLQTHKQALLFPQGPGQESIVVETRRRLHYPRDYGERPENRGPGLLLYRLDPAGRRRMMYGNAARRKITTLIRRREHYGEMWGADQFTEVSRATLPSSRNALGELWWELQDIHPQSDNAMQFDARFRATDLLENYDEALWTGSEGSHLAVGGYTPVRGHVCLCTSSATGDGSGRYLDCATGPGGRLRGRYRLPSTEPQRLYVTVGLPSEATQAVTLSISSGTGGPSTRVRLEPGTPQQAQVVRADVPAGAADLELLIQADGNGPAALQVHEAWLVDMPTAAADLVAGQDAIAWTTEPPEAKAAPTVSHSARLHDGAHYGPATLLLPLGGTAPRKWRGECSLTVPAERSVLRALVGFAHGATPGLGAKVSLRLAGPQREWNLITKMQVEVYPQQPGGKLSTRSNLLAVLQAPLPAEMAGKPGKLMVEAEAQGDKEVMLALPCLRVCTG